MSEETPTNAGGEGVAPAGLAGDTTGEVAPEGSLAPAGEAEAAKTAADAGHGPGGRATEAVSAPEAAAAPAPTPAPAGPVGQRRITRHTTTSTTRTETTTDETIVEDVQTAPPVWAAPAGEHPRPVG